MIVAERKPLDEIKSFIENYNKILIVGCGTCATVCLAGGEAEVKVVASGWNADPCGRQDKWRHRRHGRTVALLQ